jgi:2-dehydropantoate 2-reductase
MRIAVLGSGAVGGYYGARLAEAGHDVTFLARGAHLAAIRERGLTIQSSNGDAVVRARAEQDPARIGPVDLVLVTVKTYDNETALPLLAPMLGDSTAVLSLQNGVDSIDEVAAVVGASAVLGGAAYIATAVVEPGVIRQTGVHQSIAFGEVFGARPALTPRVERCRDVFASAGIEVQASVDGRVPLWEKLIYLAPFSGFTGAMRLPTGSIRDDPEIRAWFLEAVREVERLARAEGVEVARDMPARVTRYLDDVPASMRSSLLIDLTRGSRIEVEALQGSVVRRGRARGVATPIMTTLYTLLKPHAQGSQERRARRRLGSLPSSKA